MTKLRTAFKPKQWKGCCGKGCKNCEIARAYIANYGRSEGLEKLRADRGAMKKAAGKAKGGKKSKSKKKAKA